MKLKDFKTWLNQFDDDAIVKVGLAETDTCVEFSPYNWECYDYTDLTGNPFVKKGDPRENTKTLELVKPYN